jgi:purine-binding chemotaxis protein CheW
MADSTTLRALPGEYLCFKLGGESFAVPIGQVQEVLALPEVTAVPEAPVFIRGVFPLRGSVMPLLDLAGRLALTAQTISREACAVVVRAVRDGVGLTIAVQVDEIFDVAEFTAAELIPPPDFGVRIESRFLLGMRRDPKDAITALLDLERILSRDELSAAAASTGARG